MAAFLPSVCCSLVILILVGLTASLSAESPTTDVYVIPPDIPVSPLDILASALRSPHVSPSAQISVFPSIEAALTSVEQMRSTIDNNASTRVTIHLYPTTHYLSTGPLRLTTAHSNLHLTTMTPDHHDTAVQHRSSHPQSYGRATISGGIAFPAANWTRVGKSNVFTSPLPRHVTGPVNQLFTGTGQRISRTRLPLNFSEYYHYNHSLADQEQARYGFVYSDGQFDLSADDVANCMVVLYNSWTASRHYIDAVYPANHTVMFTNPAGQFIGYFIEQAQKRFHIENVCDAPGALQPNTFCYNNATQMVILATDGSYDPTDSTLPPLVTPFVQSVMQLVGFGPTQPLTNVLIDNINLQHSGWAIGRTQQADMQSVSWSSTAGLMLQYADQVLISNVAISHHGVYGIYLQDGTTAITIIDCSISDLGAGGIRMGQMDAAPAYPTTDVSVLNSEIMYGGQVFYDGCGILVHRARSVTIANNHIHHLRYTGVSAGWQWGYDESYTSDVVIAYNFIHDIGQHVLNDMGGIYMLGIQDGSVIANNVIHSVYTFADYQWGIYLDEGSSRILVSNNVVYFTGWSAVNQHYGANNTITNNVLAFASLLGPQQPGDQSSNGMTSIGIAEEHISWTFFANIVYDSTPKGRNQSAVTWASDAVQAPMHRNTYYAARGAHLTYGAEAVPFSTWQSQGHDADSVEANPRFAGRVEQCELFDVASDSPAALRGFANITRPPQWVAGCGDELEEKTRGQWRLRHTEQPYQWMLH